MSLEKLRRSIEERRQSLVETLRNGRDELDPSKQHQLYGAIKELESVVQTIDYYRDEQLKGMEFELHRVVAAPKRKVAMVFSRAGSGAKGAGSKFAAFFSEKVAGTAKRAVHATKRRIKLYREVSREVKARSKEEKKDS
jgi:hypothetical protein